MDKVKHCPGCGQSKPVKLFGVRVKSTRNGRFEYVQSYCKKCRTNSGNGDERYKKQPKMYVSEFAYFKDAEEIDFSPSEIVAHNLAATSEDKEMVEKTYRIAYPNDKAKSRSYKFMTDKLRKRIERQKPF